MKVTRKSFCRWVLYKKLGWTKVITEPQPDKCVICFAPHTSNWDFIIGLLYSRAEGIKSNFLMKKEWFFWPLSLLFKRLGGIPVWRSKHCNMTDRLAETAVISPAFQLCITPEGTRSANKDWRKGFYFIAQKANIPILLYGVDYEKKLIECSRTITPDGDVDGQMREIKLYFTRFKGRKPEKFIVGDI